ncbi:MAG: rhodanese-like domain-containing protein [Acidobacteriaceae bacterium]
MDKRRWIDVRQPGEFASGHIEGSELVPLGRLGRACETWDRKQPLTIVCLSGHRAGMAQRQLQGRGFEDIYVLPGGVRKWRAAGKPLVKTPQTTADLVRKWAGRGAIVLAAAALAYFLSPWFLVIPAVLMVRWFAMG